MKTIKYLYKQSNRLLILSLICAVASGVIGGILVAVINEGIKKSASTTLAYEFFLVCILFVVTRSISQIAMLNLTQNIVANMRIELSKKLLNCSYSKLESLGKSKLLVILTRDIEIFVGALQVAQHLLIDIAIVVSCFTYIAWFSFSLFLILFTLLVFCLVGFNFAQKTPISKLKAMRSKLDAIYKHFQDLIEGSKELQLNKRRGHLFVDKIITPDVKNFRNHYLNAFTSYALITNFGDILFYLALGTLLFIIPHYLPQSTDTLIGVTIVLMYSIGPISSIINAIPSIAQAEIALSKILQLDSDLANTKTNTPPSFVTPLENDIPLHIELSDIYYRYTSVTDDTQFTLGPLSISVHSGEILFIAGGNGSGKTSLLMLLLGLYSPESGFVRLKGTLVTEENIEVYRNQFSAVFADFYLFDYLLDLDDGKFNNLAIEYLEKFGLKNKVSVIDGKFSTLNLSSGQRKRLALIISYLEDRSIYLFDEWAAEQDPVFKRVFYEELLPELKSRGKTVIVISHDDAYFNCADRIIKLENGLIDHR